MSTQIPVTCGESFGTTDSKPVESPPVSGVDRNRASSSSQPLQALAVGNRKRSAHARIKQALKNGELSLCEAFDNEAASGLSIAKALESLPRFSPTKASAVLLALRIGYARPLDSLSELEKSWLVHALNQRFPYLKVRP